ncbi:MAG TPA: GNAT family protein [Pyrinomonadaceae bacterium]|jgi:RimJ/RimL family protein N-acetyltransferase
MDLTPITLQGKHVRLEPLTFEHEAQLNAAASDGELWNSTVTIVPDRDGMRSYIADALTAHNQKTALPFAIIQLSKDRVVGSTRFFRIEHEHRRVEIGYTWLAAGAQRTGVNTEAKLLLLTHAFETWSCIRVELFTDFLNQQSRAAILRLGATQEGVLRNHMITPSGRYRDSVCFSIIESEWPDVKVKLQAKLGRAG